MLMKVRNKSSDARHISLEILVSLSLDGSSYILQSKTVF